jgi:hypothetical protein
MFNYSCFKHYILFFFPVPQNVEVETLRTKVTLCIEEQKRWKPKFSVYFYALLLKEKTTELSQLQDRRKPSPENRNFAPLHLKKKTILKSLSQ